MGFIDTAPDTDLPVFYNVIHAVGSNAPNPKDDVMLVQYLLMAFYKNAQSYGYSKPNGAIAVTGFCGQATMNWILKFQLDACRDSPGTVAVDNRVDRIRNKNFIGTISGTYYTLGVLNINVAEINPDAFFLLPSLIPLTNPLNVPPPSRDEVQPLGRNVIYVPEESGGF